MTLDAAWYNRTIAGMKRPNPTVFYSPRTAARWLKLGHMTVRRAIADGRLPACNVNACGRVQLAIRGKDLIKFAEDRNRRLGRA